MNDEDDNLWGPSPEPDPELLERQLSALCDWLGLPSWTEHEASCLIAGVLPPERGLDTRVIGAWLPGREVVEPIRLAWRMAVEADIEHIKTLLRETKVEHDQSPKAFLEFGVDRGRVPPWLNFVDSKKECRELLSPKVRKAGHMGAESGQEKTPRQKAGIANSKIRWNGDDARTLLVGKGGEVFDGLRATDFRHVNRHSKGRWKGRLDRSDLADQILEAIKAYAPDEEDAWPDFQAVRRQINVWLNDQD